MLLSFMSHVCVCIPLCLSAEQCSSLFLSTFLCTQSPLASGCVYVCECVCLIEHAAVNGSMCTSAFECVKALDQLVYIGEKKKITPRRQKTTETEEDNVCKCCTKLGKTRVWPCDTQALACSLLCNGLSKTHSGCVKCVRQQ